MYSKKGPPTAGGTMTGGAGLLLAVGVMLLSACGTQTAPAAVGEMLHVVRSHPHDRSAYTQGFLFRDGYFYESTGLYGRSSVRRVEVETGEVVARHDLPREYFGEGLAALDGLLYQLTWREQTGFIYHVETLEPLGTFRYEGEGWGLTTDGSHLIMSDGTYRLRFLDPTSFQVVHTLEVRDGERLVGRLNELAWVQGEVWANVWQTDEIARIDPATGRVLGWLDVAGLVSRWDRLRGAEVANGIAYDSLTQRTWVTGKRWPRVFEVERR
jgi:glutaminyl-peptide cyclotransferase